MNGYSNSTSKSNEPSPKFVSISQGMINDISEAVIKHRILYRSTLAVVYKNLSGPEIVAGIKPGEWTLRDFMDAMMERFLTVERRKVAFDEAVENQVLL